MDHDDLSERSPRDLYLVVILFTVVGLPVFVFFNILTAGLFILLLLMAGAVALFAGLHYLLWGRAFTRETAWEREEEEIRDERQAANWSAEELSSFGEGEP
jgi:hypothetical protein